MLKHPRIIVAGAILQLILCSQSLANTRIAIVKNEAYKAIIDCNTRLPIVVAYKVGKDEGNEPRYPSYIDDKSLLKNNPDCHPDLKSHKFKTYQAAATAAGVKEKYDVGHLAMSNHLDNTPETIKLANQWSNLAPQRAEFNRSGGAWYASELLVECQRDIEPLIVLTGVIDIEGGDTTFMKTFKQPTPELWWRVIYFTKSNLYAAWLMPNSDKSLEGDFKRGTYDINLQSLSEKIIIRIPEIQSLIQYKTIKAGADMLETQNKGGKLSCRGRTTYIS